jgi:hypothetical protein
VRFGEAKPSNPTPSSIITPLKYFAPGMERQGEIEMIEAVLIFGILLSVFEFVVLSMVPPRYRLRLLGSRAACVSTHVVMLCVNLWIHWGTVTGTMAATGAFVTSMITIEIAKIVYGTVVDNVRVRRGIVGYRTEELVL